MLKKNYEFKQVLTKGTYYSGNIIKAVILKKNLQAKFLGIAVNKKYGKAVERNKVKRLLRENYKILEEKIKEGYAILFLIKNGIDSEKISFWSINQDMINILKSAKIMKENENEKIITNIN